MWLEMPKLDKTPGSLTADFLKITAYFDTTLSNARQTISLTALRYLLSHCYLILSHPEERSPVLQEIHSAHQHLHPKSRPPCLF